MPESNTDELVLPPGYRRWFCPECTASCTFEAMAWCPNRGRETLCGYEREKPEANGGCFEFMVPA